MAVRPAQDGRVAGELALKFREVEDLDIYRTLTLTLPKARPGRANAEASGLSAPESFRIVVAALTATL
jgi:hypothetical protein